MNNLSDYARIEYEDTDSASRPDLNRLIFDARLGKFEKILVYNHDRLARSVHEAFILKYLFQKLKVQVIYCKPGESLSSGNAGLQDFFENLLNNLSQFESSLIGSRTKLGCEANIVNGYWAGGPAPYGYKLEHIYDGRKKSVLRMVYTEARLVQEIFNLYIEGYSPKSIALLIKEKYPNNQDRKWTVNTVKTILGNKNYLGILHYNRKGGAKNPIKHDESEVVKSSEKPIFESIIDVKTDWERIEKIKSILRSNPTYLSTPFLLRDFLVYGEKEEIMKCKNNGGNKGRVYYCAESAAKWKFCIKAEPLEDKITCGIGEELTEMINEPIKFDSFFNKYLDRFHALMELYKNEKNQLSDEITQNNQLLTKCIAEIDSFKAAHSFDRKDKLIYQKNKVFLNSLNEPKTYLKLNIELLVLKASKIEETLNKPVPIRDDIKNALEARKNLLDDIKPLISDEKIYKRNLRILLHDLIEKIVISESGDKIEVFYK